MDHAELFINNQWQKLYAKDLDDSYKKYAARCIKCHAPALLCISHIGNENYFRSDLHKDECCMAIGGMKFNIPSGTVIKLDDMFVHKDKPLQALSMHISSEEDNCPDFDIDEIIEPIDNVTTHLPRFAKSCSTIYRELSKMKTSDYVTPYITVGEFLIDSRSIGTKPHNQWGGKRMVVMARSNLSLLNPPFRRPREFVCFKDAYSTDANKSIYYLVRFSDSSRDEHFRDLIFGNTEKGIEKDKHRYFVATGGLHLVYDGSYTVYELDPLSTARFCFTNRRLPINE